MKRSGILHPALSQVLARTGHTDYLTICDRGFPAPPGPERIDLALIDDIPTVLDVLRAVHREWSIERVVVTAEMEAISPDHLAEIAAAMGDVPLEVVSHREFKRLAREATATIRTADTRPYANIIVVSG